MNERTLRSTLKDLPLADLRFFETIGSTNAYALQWADQGAAHLSLVVADSQTEGRGRMGRRWFTAPGAALAFTLILRPAAAGLEHLPLLSLWSALSICLVLVEKYGLNAEVKWPNDVLIGRRKAAGILAEAVWQEDRLECLVIGMGINVTRAALPPQEELLFPATCIEEHTLQAVERPELLNTVLGKFLKLYTHPGLAGLLQTYSQHLAFLDEAICIDRPGQPPLEGVLRGITTGGELQLRAPDGMEYAIHAGDVHLRPLS
jgi:BirA family transcriptional regulator, biotin operon repressor / biotin---[acetyl-CoA-carboxylase] ligase